MMNDRCLELLTSLRQADWQTVQNTIGNSHSTLIGVLVSWYVHTYPASRLAIEGAPGFAAVDGERKHSDALLLEDDTAVGILEVEGNNNENAIDRIRTHFASNDILLGNLWFAVLVAYPGEPIGEGDQRHFPDPLLGDHQARYQALSAQYRDKCFIAISLKKQFERNLQGPRTINTDYYSGRVDSGLAMLFRNDVRVGPIQLFGAAA